MRKGRTAPSRDFDPCNVPILSSMGLTNKHHKSTASSRGSRVVNVFVVSRKEKMVTDGLHWKSMTSSAFEGQNLLRLEVFRLKKAV